MTAPKSNRDFLFALLIAVWAHVGVFFICVVWLCFSELSAKVIEEKPIPKPKDQVEITMVYEDVEEESTVALASPVDEPEPIAEELVEEEEPPPPPPTGFVQTDESQAVEQPEDAQFIGENNTTASSDAGAVAGDQPLTALAGDEEMKLDPKTRNSNFSEGAASGAATAEGGQGAPGQGQDEKTEEGEASDEAMALSEPDNAPPLPDEEMIKKEDELEESPPERKEDELAQINDALRQLEEVIAEDKEPEKKKEETTPERRHDIVKKESSPDDGGFAPRTRKTKVRGVMSANGKGSLNVENTPAGRYEAKIYKALEQHWQMENFQNRSLIAPGNITLYFRVDKNGKISKQKRVSMNGASGTQWGMVLRALGKTQIQKMSREVIKDLDGEPLELTVTFNY